MVKIGLLLSILLIVSGCAKHGMAIHTGKDFKGEIAIGWGPTSVIDADIAGEYKMCIPSKSAFDNEITENWCQNWMSQQKGE